MSYATIIPEKGQLKSVLRDLHRLAGGHAPAETNGAYEIIVPEWLADLYNAENTPAPAPRRRRKKEVEEEQ